MVEASTLQRPGQAREGLEPDQEEEDNRGGGIVRPVVKRGRHAVGVLRQELVPLDELLKPRLVQRADWLGQVPKHRRVVQVDRARVVVGEHPREHRVLREIVPGPTRQRVERHEVVKRGQLTAAPSLLRARRRR